MLPDLSTLAIGRSSEAPPSQSAPLGPQRFTCEQALEAEIAAIGVVWDVEIVRQWAMEESEDIMARYMARAATVAATRPDQEDETVQNLMDEFNAVEQRLHAATELLEQANVALAIAERRRELLCPPLRNP